MILSLIKFFEDEITITGMSSFEEQPESSKHLSVGIIPNQLVLFKNQRKLNIFFLLIFINFQSIVRRIARFQKYVMSRFVCFNLVKIDPLYSLEHRESVEMNLKNVLQHIIQSNLLLLCLIQGQFWIFLKKSLSNIFYFSRPKRPSERQGVDYVFVTREEIEAGITAGHFIEYGEYNNNLYGTMDKSILALLQQGKTPVINAHCLSLRKLRNSVFKPLSGLFLMTN